MNMPRPENDAARLAALDLYQILDTEPEPAFDDLTQLAVQLTGAAIAWIGLLDAQRQWLKSQVGLNVRELSRDCTLCAYTALQTEPLIISDTWADSRFSTHPSAIATPPIRFYAGVPLVNAVGYVLGTLAVADSVPREISTTQIAGLQALGRQAIAQLEFRRHLLEQTHLSKTHQQTQQLLRKAKDELEMRVAERTAELISVNERLQLELNERKQIEEALRVSQARFAGILEIADDAIIAIDSAQQITLFNQGAERIFGFSTAEVLGQPLNLLLPNRYATLHLQHVQEFVQGQSQARRMGERREIFGRRRDGTEFPAEASISQLKLGDERILTVILRDITERRRTQEALAHLSRQNTLILNSMGEGICGLDLQGRITFVNPAAAKLLSYSVGDLIGHPIQAIVTPANSHLTSPSDDCLTIATSLWDGAIHQVTNATFQRQDGSTFPAEYTSTPIREKDAIIGAVVAFKDITDRQIVERMKDEFISVVSHELRTPLTSIHGALGMLASGLLQNQPEKSQRLLAIAVESTDRLVRLINDILDVERIESGKVKMAKQACDIMNLIAQAVDVMQPMADKAGVKLAIAPLSACLWVDPDRILQTLTNLLSNAIKFSPPEATVSIKVIDQGDRVLLQVQDQGRGIPADKLETIFERFQQVDASDSRNQDGTGLGLAICRSIVQQHGGKIWVESVVGQGSTFSLTLPCYQSDWCETTAKG